MLLNKGEILIELLSKEVDDLNLLCKFKYTQCRDPLRDPEIIKRDLATAYVAWRKQDWGQDISEVICVRKFQLRKRA
jgi:hypothetical protein